VRPASLAPGDTFPRRHIGPDESEVREMLSVIGLASLDALVEATVPAAIRLRRPLRLPEAKQRGGMADKGLARFKFGPHSVCSPSLYRYNRD
jgi:glycine cleavage system pyridoxal-binding protein P